MALRRLLVVPILVAIGVGLLPSSALARTCVATAGACLDTNESEPLAGRLPLILIHGWNPRSVPAPPLLPTWNNFALYHASDPTLRATFKLYAFSYLSNDVGVPELAGALRDVLEAVSAADPSDFGTKPVVIIAHSLGGIIARSLFPLLQQTGSSAGQAWGLRVSRLITLGTPHHGSMLANGPAAVARAGPFWGPLLSQFNALFFSSGGPSFTQPNRFDLLWDNFDGLLDYQTFPTERNALLTTLNNSSTFDDRIVAYAGIVVPSGQCGTDLFCLGSTLIAGAFGLPGDGVVPLGSAHLHSAGGQARVRPRFFPGYNHSEIAAGKGNVLDQLLFGQIKVDLLEVVVGSGPGAPRNLHVTSSGSTVTLTWDAAASGGPATTYVVEAGSSAGASDVAVFDTGSIATVLVLTDVPPGTFFIRVRARNAAGTSGASNEVILTTGGPGPCLPPPAPTGLTAAVAGPNVTLNWNAAAGAASHVINVGSGPGLSNFLSQNVGSLTAVVGTAPPGTYFVRVHGVSACGAQSGPSNEVMVTVP